MTIKLEEVMEARRQTAKDCRTVAKDEEKAREKKPKRKPRKPVAAEDLATYLKSIS